MRRGAQIGDDRSGEAGGSRLLDRSPVAVDPRRQEAEDRKEAERRHSKGKSDLDKGKGILET